MPDRRDEFVERPSWGGCFSRGCRFWSRTMLLLARVLSGLARQCRRLQIKIGKNRVDQRDGLDWAGLGRDEDWK